MTAATPKVTLAMPVFNGSNYIRDALDSILAQTFTDFELVVCDNASTDETCAIVQEYAAKDPRIVLIRNPKNLGASANYNLGFEHGRGRYLKWCAHDDQLSANFLAECVKVLDASPDVALAFGSTRGITPTNEITTPTGADTPSLDSDDPAMRFRQAIELAGTCFPIFGLFRRENLAKSTLHRPYYGSDRAVLAEAALMGKFVRVEDAIFYNREHEQRSINIDDKVQRSLWQTGKKSRGRLPSTSISPGTCSRLPRAMAISSRPGGSTGTFWGGASDHDNSAVTGSNSPTSSLLHSQGA